MPKTILPKCTTVTIEKRDNGLYKLTNNKGKSYPLVCLSKESTEAIDSILKQLS